jgi:hypothetical protein
MFRVEPTFRSAVNHVVPTFKSAVIGAVGPD